MVAQIIVSVGTLSIILQEAGWLASERKKTVGSIVAVIVVDE